MPQSKRAKARRRKRNERRDAQMESLADWFEENMPGPDGGQAEHTTGGQRSQDAWEFACDLFPVIERMWTK